MTNLAQVKNINQFHTTTRPVVEPLDAPEALMKKMERFPEEVYSKSRDSHLFRFLLALCGEAGAGALKKEQLYTRLQSMLEATHYGDIDLFYGNPLHLPRLNEEIYTVNPHNEVLTQAQWQEVKIRDARYKNRCLLWMRAIIHGSSLKGLALAGEAATGIECDVFERYKYLENQASDDIITVQDIGQTTSAHEFVIIPRTHSITEEEKRRIVSLTSRLKPENSIISVYDGTEVRMEKAIMDVDASTDAWNILRFVKGRDDINWPTVNTTIGDWIEGGVEKEAPTAAWIDKQETATYLSVTNIVSSSTHVGPFNKVQKDLYSHLKEIPEQWFIFKPERAYAKNFAPIRFTVPWTTR